MVLDGRGEVQFAGDKETLAFSAGDTVLIPAGLATARLKTLTDCKWLEVTIPASSDLADFPRPNRAELAGSENRGFVSLNPPGS